LNCELKPIDPKSDKYKFLANYFNSNKGGTHQSHSCLEIFEVERAGEKKKFKDEIDNHCLLWHGSGYYNYGGILS